MRIGFFGGAFDPFHNEHKRIIESAKNELNLDRIVVYPSFAPPHKECTAPYDDRKALAEIALSGCDYAVIDDVEKERGGEKNPTVEILPLLIDKYPADEHYFIMGGDSIINFPKWINPQKIATMIKLAVIARENATEVVKAAEEAEKNYGASVRVLDYVGRKVSGSLVKAALELGDMPNGISEEVYVAIRERGLYCEKKNLTDKLRTVLPERTFEHVKRTVYYALGLNVKLGLNYEKVFLAALLHDCAKPFHRAMEGVPAAVEHQFLGREEAEKTYGIRDEEILSAIECHTTGKPAMSTLEKLIFCADMLEEGRSYPGVCELRNAIETDFETGFRKCVESSLRKLEEDGKPIHPLTKECAKYYNINIR